MNDDGTPLLKTQYHKLGFVLINPSLNHCVGVLFRSLKLLKLVSSPTSFFSFFHLWLAGAHYNTSKDKESY